MTTKGGLVALTHVTRDFAEGTADYRRLLDTIARRVAETFEGACSVSLVSSDGAWLRPVAVHVVAHSVVQVVDGGVMLHEYEHCPWHSVMQSVVEGAPRLVMHSLSHWPLQ